MPLYGTQDGISSNITITTNFFILKCCYWFCLIKLATDSPFNNKCSLNSSVKQHPFSSLDLISHVLGVPTSKENLEGSMVHETFWGKKMHEEIKDYCEKDVLCTMNCFKKISL